MHSLIMNGLQSNLTDDLDDYSIDNEFEYSDYVYEDSIDESTSSTTSSTTPQSSSLSIYDDILIDDLNTVSYYDYGEQDEIDDTSTQRLSLPSTTTTTTATLIRIPSYHQRRPIVWNINIDNDPPSKQQYNSSSSLHYSLLLLLFLNFIPT